MFGFNLRANYKSMTPDEVKTELSNDKNIILLDVRTREEYRGGHIPKSILIPLDELDRRAESELKDKGAEIIVYCRSGGRSASAASMLTNLGYTNVCNMIGGIMSWKYEVE